LIFITSQNNHLPMKKTNKRTRRVITGLMACLLLSGTTFAQTIVGPSNPDRFLTSATNSNGYPTVNCDMLTTGNGELQVIAWNGINGADIEVNDNAGNSTIINIPNGWMPDVVLADDTANLGGSYIVAVVYRDMTTMKAYFDTYKISGMGTGPITYSIASSNPLGNAWGNFFPHIDMFADPNSSFNGLPVMKKFVISWDEVNGAGCDVYAGYGSNVGLPLSYVSTLITSSPTTGILHDIAASTDISTGAESGYIVTGEDALSTNQLLITTMDCSAATPSTTSAAITLTGKPYIPRIEAMSLYNSASAPATASPWCAVSTVLNTTSFISSFWQFSNTTGTGYNSSTGFLANVNNWMGAVAGGTSSVSGSFGDKNYTFGWYMESGRYLTQAIDYATSALNTTFPDYYMVNSGGVGGFGGKSPIGITTSSNSGKATLTAWYDKPTGNIWYKMTGDVSNYKPGQTTGVGSVTMKHYRISPNPATSQLNVEGVEHSPYTITGINGSLLGSGTLTTDKHVIDTKSLPVGVYLLHLNESGKSQSIRFVKQ
jgi:hypothetical protein